MKRRDPTAMQRAYSTLEVKSINEEERIIEGIATTPTPDRVGDVVEPKGAKFELPLPLLSQHNSKSPIGHVIEAKVTAAGIKIKAQIARIAEAGLLRDRIDAAWQELKYGLVRGLSIGFVPNKDGAEPLDPKDPWGGYKFTDWNWLELSAVTIPANVEATIETIKHFDLSSLSAASGVTKAATVVVLDGSTRKPGASGSGKPIINSSKGSNMRTIAERLAAFEAKRQATLARLQTIDGKADEEGRSLNEDETREYDELTSEVETIDKEIARLKKHESLVVQSATAVHRQAGEDPERGSEARGGITFVKRNLPKGVAFARFAMSLAASKGNLYEAANDAKQRWGDTPEIAEMLKNYKNISDALEQKTAVAVGDTTTSGWASQLVVAQNMVSEFVELLRPQTIIGRLPPFRNVPFNIAVPRETAGSSVGWVGQKKPAKVTRLTLDSISLGMSKISGIIVLSQELVRASSPSAQALCRDDMIAATAQFMDEQLVDPTVAAVANVSPASLTNGVTDVASSGETIAAIDEDVRQVMQAMITANISLANCAWAMNPRTALSLSLKRTAQDVLAYPGVTATGGTFKGLPVVTSNSVKIATDTHSTTNLILLAPGEVLMADDGGVSLDVSTEASVELDDSPTTGAATLVSLWQHGLVGLRAQRAINWLKRRAAAAQYISGVQY